MGRRITPSNVETDLVLDQNSLVVEETVSVDSQKVDLEHIKEDEDLLTGNK